MKIKESFSRNYDDIRPFNSKKSDENTAKTFSQNRSIIESLRENKEEKDFELELKKHDY